MIKYIIPKNNESFDKKEIIKRSSERLAELMKLTGKDDFYIASLVKRSRTIVTRYRTGKIEMPKDVIARLSQAFGVSKLWLMGFSDLED